MVKTLLSNAGSADSIPSQGAKILCLRPKTKTYSRSNIVTNSVMTFENGPHQEKKNLQMFNYP